MWYIESFLFPEKQTLFQTYRNARGKHNFIKKETLAQVFSCEFWGISNNTFCYRTPPVAVSEISHLNKMLEECIWIEFVYIVTKTFSGGEAPLF